MFLKYSGIVIPAKKLKSARNCGDFIIVRFNGINNCLTYTIICITNILVAIFYVVVIVLSCLLMKKEVI